MCLHISDFDLTAKGKCAEYILFLARHLLVLHSSEGFAIMWRVKMLGKSLAFHLTIGPITAQVGTALVGLV